MRMRDRTGSGRVYAGEAGNSRPKVAALLLIFHFTVTTVSNENSIEKALCLLPCSKFPALLVHSNNIHQRVGNVIL